MPSPAVSAVPTEGPHAAAEAAGAPGFTAVAGAAAAVAGIAAAVAGVTSGASWFLSAEGDREGGDLNTAMPKAGTAAPPGDSNTS